MRASTLILATVLTGCGSDPCQRKAGELLQFDGLVVSEYLRRPSDWRHLPPETVVVWAEVDATCVAEASIAPPGAAVPFPLMPSPTREDHWGGWWIYQQLPTQLRLEFRNGETMCVGAGAGCGEVPPAIGLEPEGPWMDVWDWYVYVWFPLHPDTGFPDVMYKTTDLRE